MILILLLWIILILYGAGKNKEGISPLERKQSEALRGICAIEIMIGHIGLATGNPVLFVNRKAGILFVGIFFMLSGYGIAYGVEHKPEYFKYFIARKAVKLLVPAYVAYAVFTAASIVILGEMEWTKLFDMAEFAQKTNWYVWEQMAFYILVCLAYMLLPRRANLVVAVVSLAFVVLAYIAGLDNPYYGSTLCFSLGLYYYRYESRLTQLFNRYFTILLLGFGVLLMLSLGVFFLLGNDSVLGNPVARNSASVSFCVTVLLLLEKFRVGGKPACILGKYSYEIFLVHPYVLALLKQTGIASQFVFGIICILISLGGAVILHGVMSKMSDFKKTLSPADS